MWDTAAIYMTGVRILLRESIYHWAVLFCAPVFRFANRIFIGWATVFLLLFNPTNQAHAEPLAVTIVQSKDGGAYQKFTSALRGILPKQGIHLVITSADKAIPDSGLVISLGMKAAAAVAASSAPFVLNVLIQKAGYETLLRDFPQRSDSHTTLGHLSGSANREAGAPDCGCPAGQSSNRLVIFHSPERTHPNQA